MQEGVIQALHLRNSSIKTCRCSPPSVRCNLKSCNTASRANTARNRGWKPRRGPSCAGSRPPPTKKELDSLTLPTGAKLAYDIGKNPVVLFNNDWSANYFSETNKGIELSAVPVQTARD